MIREEEGLVKKQQMNQTTMRAGTAISRKKSPMFVILAICLLLGVSLAVSTALMGGSIGKLAETDAGVISLIPPQKTPPENTRPESGSNKTVYVSGTKARNTIVRESGITARSGTYQGELEVFDDKQTWGSETQVDLFQNSYDQTVVSDDGEKVVAPGTSYFYRFSLKNNGSGKLNYYISVKVDSYLADQSVASDIPLEWRLLTGDGGTPITAWRGYAESAQILNETMLKAKEMDSYVIEWRWTFERGDDMDRSDTEMGDLAVTTPLNAKATITVYAEQLDEPSRPWWRPDTGDTFMPLLYLVLLGASGFGLVMLVMARRRKKDEDGTAKRELP